LTRRVDATLSTEVAWLEKREPVAFACGPASLGETVAGALAGLGYPLGLSQEPGASPGLEDPDGYPRRQRHRRAAE
jgi:hypothetical protein